LELLAGREAEDEARTASEDPAARKVRAVTSLKLGIFSASSSKRSLPT
jgi:hypothetical protein